MEIKEIFKALTSGRGGGGSAGRVHGRGGGGVAGGVRGGGAIHGGGEEGNAGSGFGPR